MAGITSTILFATNRLEAPQAASWGPTFGDTVASFPGTPQDLACSTATITDIDIQNADGGTISKITPINRGGFTAEQLAPLVASTNDILVFVHGTDNGFNDAIKRAAYNQAWLAASGRAAMAGERGQFDMICFTWPSRSYSDNLLGEVNLFGDFSDYLSDQKQAVDSAYHFGLFLQQIASLRHRTGLRRVNLLCHSMGNYMLASAVGMLFQQQNQAPRVPIFDEIILAAADEQSSTFSQPDGQRLSDLWRLGHEITSYCNNVDVLMHVSHLVNAAEGFRLGYDGPPNEADTRFFSPNVYEFVDCTGVNDSISHGLLDSHQYYRESPTVRADIVATLLGLTPKRPAHDLKGNFYSLFPQ